MTTIAVDRGTTPPEAPERSRGFWRAAVSGAVTVALLGVLALAVAVGVAPRVMGGVSLTVLTGSMEPAYSPGDMVVAVPQDDYAIGDVVTFHPLPNDPTLITHRIVGVHTGGDGERYVTRGDANGADDDPIEVAQIVGEVQYAVPYVGHAANLAGNQQQHIIAFLGLLLVGYGVIAVGSSTIGNRTSREKAES